ncbi:hypothetical protein [Thermococcus sp. AM4]|uniref:hypothetical protein n=1 Tax=Thermococcus sp. (strain AM4) TaxID=246969 RepID=UPI0001870A7A|nr:hypothetical protein [Thermococcus sp. AM4]EEB73285.1 hypothetical protein TAM4_2142 [Thermococcus sp. AM4]
MKNNGKKLIAVLFLFLLLVPLVLADENEKEDENEYDAGYTAFAVLGVVLIGAGVAYYALTKRKLLIRHRRGDRWGFEIQPEHPYVTFIGPVSPMTIHHALTITGTVLVFVHFLSCGNYAGIGGIAGLAMGITLIALNALGFIGRAINRKILALAKAGRKEEVARYVKMYQRWKKAHIALAVLFAVLLAIHLNAVD